MTSIYEQSHNPFLEKEVFSILQRYGDSEDENVILKELINCSYLIMQQIKIQ